MRSIRALYVFTGSVFLCALAGCGGSQAPVTKAAATNPVPVITSLSPNSANAGAAAQSVTIHGTGFMATTTATFNGAPVTVAYTSASEIAIPLSTSEQAAGGVFPVVVINPSPGGGSSQPANFTVNNPAPALTSVSPGVFAVGSPETPITLVGTGFVPTSTVTAGGVKLATQYVSGTGLTASLPASEFAAGGTLQLAVVNPSPGGGATAALPATVVAVAALTIVAVPQAAGTVSGAWNLAVAAEDPNGNPIVGLSVALSSDAGTLSAASEVTDSAGTLGATLNPPTGSGAAQSAAISATAGAQTAVAVASFATDPTAGSSAVAEALRRAGRDRALAAASQASTLTTFYASPVSVGLAGSPGASTPFASNSTETCYSDSSMTSGSILAGNCATLTAAQNVSVQQPNLDAEACQAASLAGDITGVAECAGAVAIPAFCAAATPETGGLAAMICGATLTSTEVALGEGCLHLIAEAIANAEIKNKTQAAAVSLIACTDPACALQGVAAIACSTVTQQQPSPSQPPCAGGAGLTQQICPAGQSCIFVADYAADQIYAFDPRGNPIAIPPGAFPNLDGPDGLAYDASDGDLYVANTGNGTITAYDQYGNEVCPPGGFPGTGTGDDLEDVAFDAYSHQLYVNDVTSGQILAYDDAGNPVALPSGAFLGVSDPYGIFWDPTTDEVYISDDATNAVTTFDPGGSPFTLSGNFGGLTDPDDFAVDPLTGEMFVTEAATTFGFCTTSGIAAFDENGNPIALPAGAFSTATCPDDIALWGSGNTAELYVSNLFGSSVTVYNVTGTDVGATVAPGGFPGLSEPTGIVIVTTPAATSASASPQSGSAPPARSAPADAGGGRGGAR